MTNKDQEEADPAEWTRAMMRRRSDEDVAYSDSPYKGSPHGVLMRGHVEWPDMPRTPDARQT